MSSELRLGGAPLEVRLNRQARRLRLRLDPRTGAVVLTLPPGVPRRRALAWAAQHAEWAEQALRLRPVPVAIAPGCLVPLYGRPHRIDWAADRPRRVGIRDDEIQLGGPAESLERRLLRWMQAEAKTVLAAETAEFARAAGVEVARVGVGDPVSRWGSCSSAGAIRYSWRLIMAPPFVRRATVAHEVAHRVHMDHSPRFHALVRDLLGTDPRPARAWLRSEGAGLHRIGRPG